MPTVRYQIRNEYGLADPEVYRAVDKDDPEALLEGVAMAGLVGVLRQLGDLAEFASEVFHNLHEEVMTTSARGHGLMLRVLQLEAEFPSIEKVILSETDHSHCAYSAGIDWHANHRVEQNLFSQGDMPRFILDSYEECRGPPQLFMLDKFDVAGAGACLTRYSNPSFFKTASAFSEMMEEAQREKKTRKPKKKGSYWKSGETIESFFTPIMDHLQFTASEPPRGKFPRRLVKLKHRKLRVSDISNKKSYMEGFLKEESFEHIDSESSLRGFPDNKSIDGAPVAEEVIIGGVTDPLPVRKEFSPFSLNDVTAKVQNQKRKDGEFLETDSISSSVSQKIYPNSQNAKEAMLASLGNEVDIHAFDISSDEIDTYPPPLQLASQNNILGVSGFTTDDDPDSCRSDDIGSELENYVDALNTMESEIEISSDSRAKPDLSLFKRESQGTDPNVNGQVELQHQSSGSSIVGSFGTSVISEEVKDGMPSLSQSTILVDLPEQQRKVRTVFEETSSLEFNHGETGKLETMSEDMTLIPSACLTSNETCYRNQPNAAMVVPSSRDAFTSCTTDSDLKSQHSLEEAQSLATHSVELNSSSIKNTPDIDEHIESSFLSWQTNHFVIFPACEEHPDILNDISEEKNPIEYSEDRNSVNIIDKGYMPSTFSETEYGIFPERAPECSKDLSTLLDDGIGKPLEVSEPNKNDYISKSSKPTIPVGSTALESQDTSNDLEIDVQSEDLAVNFPPNFMEGEDEEGKQLNSGVLFSTEIHELSLVESNESGLHRSTQTSEHVNDALACISDERGSPHGSQNNAVISRLSGYTDKKMSNDLANTLEMAQSPQTQAESSLVDVSSVCVKDSLHDSVENDNEACSVENLSPKSSAFSFDIVSSILQSESFATEIGYISATHEKFEHPKLSSSSGNIDILGCDALNYAAIPYELEHFPDVDNPQESSNGVMLKPFSSSCREDPAANKLHCEVSDLIETNGEESVHDGLKIANGSTKLSVQQDLQMLAENKINSFNGNCIPVDSMNDQNLNMIESAKVTTFDFLVEEDPHSGNDMLHQPYPDIEEPDLPRDLTSLQSENKSYSFFIENEEIETFSSSVSESQSFALDLSNSSEATLVHVKEDKLCSRENEQDFGSKSDNVATKDDTDGGGLSLLQSSNVCNFDVQFQEHPISEDAVFNLHESVTAELNGSNSDSKFNIVAQDGSDGQNLCLLESSNLYRFDVQSQEDSVSEGASLNQHMPEIQETAIESDLTSSTFESKLLAPLCEDEDQQAVGIVLSSQSQALNLSNFTYAKLADYKFDDVNMEESLISSREDEQHLDSDASMQHFQVDSERSETPSEKSSVSQAVDEPSLPSYRVLENIEPSYIQLDEVYSDELAIIQYNSEHEELLPVPEPETLLNHGCKNELNMPLSKTHENEQTETDISVSFQGVSKHHGDSMASEALSSESTVADFMIPIPAIGTHAQDTINILPGETISSIPINEVIEETPPLPPLPPMQWRMGKPQLGSLIAGASEPVMKTRPFIFPSSTGSNMHINPLPTSEEKMNQYAGPFVLPFTFEESFQSASSCTDGQLTESLKSSEFPVTTLDQRQQLEIYSSGLSLKEDDKHSHGIIKKDGESTLTVAPSLRDVISEQPDLLASGNPQAAEERRPKLVKLLPGLELERLIESPVMDRDAIPPLSSFMFVPTSGDGLYQYGYREYGGYEGDSTHYHKLSTPLPVAVQSIRPYAYHMFLREGNSSSMYDILLQDMEADQPNEKHHSILSRPRDPLIEAVAAHDKSTLRKVSELDRPLPEPKEDEKNYLLEQIKTKSLNLKPSTSKANVIKAPSTNLRVAAILEKANAIRQACVGSDEDDDDSWNDS